MTVKTYKTHKTHLISGAGNIFHITYAAPETFLQGVWSLEQMKDIAQKACARNPADGFIFLEKNNSNETVNKTANENYRWHFFNNDGSNAEMCGNATRCVGYYLKNILKSKSNTWHLSTVAGTIQIDFIETEKYKIIMTAIQKLQSHRGFYCDTGVPHLVLEKTQLTVDDCLKTEAQALRWHSDFSPRGTNVTFVVLEEDKTKVKAVSYERGVENFTAACGTGAMAAALYNLTKRGELQSQVEMPGGTLMMDLSNLQKPSMTGPSVLLGSYEYEISI